MLDSGPCLLRPPVCSARIQRELHLTPQHTVLSSHSTRGHRWAPASPQTGHLTHGVQTQGLWPPARATPALCTDPPFRSTVCQLGTRPPGWAGPAGEEKGNPGHTSPWQPNTLAAGGARQERRGLKETTKTPTHCASGNEHQGNASAREERAHAPRQSGAVGDDPQAGSELHATPPGNNSRLLGNSYNAYYEDGADGEERTTK